MCRKCRDARRLRADGGRDVSGVQSRARAAKALGSLSPEEEAVRGREQGAYAGTLSAVHSDLVAWLDEPSPARLNDRLEVRLAVDGVFDRYRESLDERFESMTMRGAIAGRESVARRFNLDLEPDSLTRPVERDLLQIARSASEATHSRMVRDIADAIADASQDGMSSSRIQRRLDKEILENMRRHEARRAAQTEVHAGAERGKLAGYEDLRSVANVMWVSAFLATSRDDHMAASGQLRRPGDTFSLGGGEARYPGDASLPPGQRINCMCSLVPAPAPTTD